MNKIVLKFGGSSVDSVAKIKQVADFVSSFLAKYDQIIVVVSAMGKTTNNLTTLANEVASSPNERELDRLLSTGECQSSALLAMALIDVGLPARSFNCYEAGIITDQTFGRAFIRKLKTNKLVSALEKKEICVVAGFQGMSTNGEITTLGRGGSDTTAVSLAAKFNCPCKIFTDVKGIYSSPQKINTSARPIKNIHYNNMTELSLNGAKVLETRSAELAKKWNVPLYVGKSCESTPRGTNINKKYFEYMQVDAMTADDSVSVITINFNTKDAANMSRTLSLLHSNNIPIKNLTTFSPANTGYCSLSFSLSYSDAEKIIPKLENMFNNVQTTPRLVKITLVGNGLCTHTHSLIRTINALNKNNIAYNNLTCNENTISLSVPQEKKDNTISVLTDEFDL